MTTAVNNKKYGFNAEAELLEYLRQAGFKDVERLHLTGAEDEGDLVAKFLGATMIIQLKTFSARTKTGAERPLTPGRVRVWQQDLRRQIAAYKAHRGLTEGVSGILVVKFKGTSWADALVIKSLGNWSGVIYDA